MALPFDREYLDLLWAGGDLSSEPPLEVPGPQSLDVPEWRDVSHPDIEARVREEEAARYLEMLPGVVPDWAPPVALSRALMESEYPLAQGAGQMMASGMGYFNPASHLQGAFDEDYAEPYERLKAEGYRHHVEPFVNLAQQAPGMMGSAVPLGVIPDVKPPLDLTPEQEHALLTAAMLGGGHAAFSGARALGRRLRPPAPRPAPVRGTAYDDLAELKARLDAPSEAPPAAYETLAAEPAAAAPKSARVGMREAYAKARPEPSLDKFRHGLMRHGYSPDELSAATDVFRNIESHYGKIRPLSPDEALAFTNTFDEAGSESTWGKARELSERLNETGDVGFYLEPDARRAYRQKEMFREQRAVNRSLKQDPYFAAEKLLNKRQHLLENLPTGDEAAEGALRVVDRNLNAAIKLYVDETMPTGNPIEHQVEQLSRTLREFGDPRTADEIDELEDLVGTATVDLQKSLTHWVDGSYERAIDRLDGISNHPAITPEGQKFVSSALESWTERMGSRLEESKEKAIKEINAASQRVKDARGPRLLAAPATGRPALRAAYEAGKPEPVAPEPEVPSSVQRFEEPGVDPGTTEKPHGLYTSPGHVDSPHADLGGARTDYLTNPDANVLKLDTSGRVNTQRGRFIGQPAGHAAIRHLAGESEYKRLTSMRRDALTAELSERYPEVNWSRYDDEHDMIDGVGGLMARENGYDAIFGFNRSMPDFDEYVGLTGKAFKPEPVAPEPLASATPAPLRPVKPVEQTRWFHGTKADISDIGDFDPYYHGNPENLFGYGLYLTDEPAIATGYAKTRGPKASPGQIMEVQVDALNTLDLDRPLPPDVVGHFGTTLYGETYTPDPNATGREVVQGLRDFMGDHEFPTSEASEVLGDLAEVLKDKGYAGMRHIGGRTGRGVSKGKPEHNVLILFDPNDIYVPSLHGQPVRQPRVEARSVRSEPVAPEPPPPTQTPADVPFDPTTTDVPFIDNMLKDPARRDYFRREKGYEYHQRTMTPQEYLDISASGGRGTGPEAGIDRGTVADYAEKMRQGELFPTLMLDWSSGRLSQEGRHRALAAIEAGVDEVPVVEVLPTDWRLADLEDRGQLSAAARVRLSPSPPPPTQTPAQTGGPHVGPRGGKWVDPQHKTPWMESMSAESVRAHVSAVDKGGKHGHPATVGRVKDVPHIKTTLSLDDLDVIEPGDTRRVAEYAARETPMPAIQGGYNARSHGRGKATVYVPNGNHRVAAAKLRGDTHIEVIMPTADFELWSSRTSPPPPTQTPAKD